MLVVKPELGEVLVLIDDFVLDEGVILVEEAMELASPSLEWVILVSVTAELDKTGTGIGEDTESGTATRK